MSGVKRPSVVQGDRWETPLLNSALIKIGKGRKDATKEGVVCVGRKRSDDLPSLTPPRNCEEGYSTTKGHELVARARGFAARDAPGQPHAASQEQDDAAGEALTPQRKTWDCNAPWGS